MIPYGKQSISKDDVDAVIDVLKSDFLTQGPAIEIFEDKVKDYCKSRYASSFNSATSALHAACMAIGVGKGDYVWTSAITFVASSNCALYCGANIDFIDIDSNSSNICIDKLEEKLKKSQQENTLPKAIIPVHLTGQSCDMKKIKELSDKYGFSIIEDASHAIGGKYLGDSIGSCKYSDVTIFSFHPVKIITTAEGGIATTNDKNLFNKLNLFRSHGITRDKNFLLSKNEGPWYYEQLELGYNYRMTDLQAALGSSQMNQLESFVTKRHELASRYDSLLKDVNVKTPIQCSYNYSSYHLYVIRVNSSCHRSIFENFRKKNILVNLHYIPVYHHPYYQKLGFKNGYCPEAEQYYSEAISIPIYPDLKKEEQQLIVDILISEVGKI
tara:strand:+ start:9727 stop:10878 length:1152 start_codon:yes stop_codon:yes gene_type:complete